MNKCFVFFLISLSFSFAKAAEPVVKPEPLPSDKILEQYEESEATFSQKMFHYYKQAVALESQIILLKSEPVVTVDAPTFEELEDMSVKSLKKMYRVLTALYNQVQSLPESPENQIFKDIKSKNSFLELDNFLLKDQIYRDSLELTKQNYFKLRYLELIKETDALRLSLDSVYYECKREMWDKIDNISALRNKLNMNQPLLSVSAAGAGYAFHNKEIDNKISPVFQIHISPGSFIGIGKNIGLWAEYSVSRFNVSNQGMPEIEFYADWFAGGIDGYLSLRETFKTGNVDPYVKLGLGYFYSRPKAPNQFINETNWEGAVIKTEIGFVNYSIPLPIALFFAADFNSPVKDAVIPGFSYNNINLGKRWINRFSIGLRIPIVLSQNN